MHAQLPTPRHVESFARPDLIEEIAAKISDPSLSHQSCAWKAEIAVPRVASSGRKGRALSAFLLASNGASASGSVLH